MERIDIGSTTLELARGDITHERVDAIVNAANSALGGGGGVDGAIHSAAGPELAFESRALAPCPTGEARLTKGYRLPAQYVIHAVGPRYRDGQHGEASLLANAYRNSLLLADDRQVNSLAFPAISTGIYGYPADEAARIALTTVRDHLQGGTSSLRLVRFVLWSDRIWTAFSAALATLVAPPGDQHAHNTDEN